MTKLTSNIFTLADISPGHEAVCFAALSKKDQRESVNGPFFIMTFKDKTRSIGAPIFSSHALYQDAFNWEERAVYRLECVGKADKKYGIQLDVKNLRKATVDDEAEGYDSADFFEWSRYSVDLSFQRIMEIVNKDIQDPYLKQIVERLLTRNAELFKKMPAAENMHHPFSGGLVEHIWSVTSIAAMLAKHYSKYYSELNPPLNKSLVIAGAILHDIGKLHEFSYDPSGARYTPAGRLVGHIIIGRDMIREEAKEIEGFPEETLLLLDHLILSHHGKPEFDAARRPMTLEALLLNHADEIDARMNSGVRALTQATGNEPFTNKIFGWDNVRIYRGTPIEAPDEPE
jgi:3'-5' exoribonuclease